MEEHCLFPSCEKGQVARGLCTVHYPMAKALVMRGKITWDGLVSVGKAKASRLHGKEVRSWFLEK